jgi:hypothetical protein
LKTYALYCIYPFGLWRGGWYVAMTHIDHIGTYIGNIYSHL